jgi:hypothetical protein
LCSEPPALEVAPEEPRANADEEGAHDDRDHDGGEDLGVVGAVAFYTARQARGRHGHRKPERRRGTHFLGSQLRGVSESGGMKT